jgi:phosphate transport system permease protein
MTDIAATARPRAVDLSSDAARRRTRKRYRAEARFRAYGIAAILFALAFLVFLIGDILIKAYPAFTLYSLTLEVEASRDAIDPNSSGDPALIARGDFAAPIRTALQGIFPEAAAERRARQRLNGLVSSAGGEDLRRAVVANPALVGTRLAVPVLLSDDADLFFKGTVTDVDVEAGRGVATPSAASGDVTILSSANDFAGPVVDIKRAMSVEARRLRGEVERYEGLLASYGADLIGAQADLAAARVSAPEKVPSLEGVVAKLTADRDSIAGQIEGLGAAAAELESHFTSSGAEKLDAKVPSLLIEINGGVIKVTEAADSRVSGTTLIPLQSADEAAPGTWKVVALATPESNRKLSDQEIAWLMRLQEEGHVSSGFNWLFFTSGDSREAELAGILGALAGSFYTMLVTLIISLPIGVAAAVYLEEFAPKNAWTDVIEVNINNLAAVPSIIFGLLGLAIFLNFFGLPRSTPLVGGLVLALLVLPTIIIASRAALKAVPPSIREAALGVGASHQQAVFHHVLPLAMPGVLTGTIIGMAHALGETAPLLLIGMIAFIVDVPGGPTDAATVLPVQIFLWSDLPEVGFQAKTAAAIIVLLMFLLVMNGAAITLRKRFERRW